MADTASLAQRPGVPARKRFTGEEVLDMIAKGVLPGDRVELLDGDIWEMPSEGPSHGRLAVWLTRWLVLNVPAGVQVACERTLRLADTHWPEPDFFLFSDRLQVDEVRGPDVLLLIEIADSSVQDDLKVKAPKYREHGVTELWVVDVNARTTHVHRGPREGGWESVTRIPFEDALVPLAPLDVSLRLADAD